MKRLLLAAAAIVTAAWLTASCVPTNLSPECKKQISECLADCPDDVGRETRWQETYMGGNDTRSECHKHCHGVCSD